MAISSARSLSPSRPRTAPDSRTPETGVRKSFSGNQPFSKPLVTANRRSFDPSTPANSPSDVLRKVPGVLRASFDQKENEKDLILKLTRVKSPLVSKGAKSFMAPTISAASKMTPKKILAERNDAIRSSVIESDGSCSVVVDSEVPPESRYMFSKPRIEDSEEAIASKPEGILKSQVIPDTQNFAESLSEGGISETCNRTVDLSSKRVKFVLPVKEDLGEVTELKPEETPIPEIPLDAQNFSESLPESRILESRFENVHLDLKAKPQNFSSSLPESEVSENKNVDSSSKFKPCSSPINDIAPLDSDPSLLPYDPKTNYLSPRPQFLHYRPKPRIEVYLNKEREVVPGEGKKLEDSFTSESCSDTEVSEETQSPESQKETENASNSSTPEIVSEEEEGPHVSVPILDSTDEEKQLISSQGAQKSRRRSRVRSKIGYLLLLLVLACLSFPVIDSPVFPPSGHKGHTFNPDSSAKIAEFAKTSLDDLTSNIKIWSAKSFSYLSELISPKAIEDIGFYSFTNLTSFPEEALDEELSNDDYLWTAFSSKETEEEFEQNVLEQERGTETEEVPKEEQNQIEQIQGEAEVESVAKEEFGHRNSDVQSAPVAVSENVEAVQSQDQDKFDSLMNKEIEEHSSLVTEAPDGVSEKVEVFYIQDQENFDSQMNTQPTELDVTPPSSGTDALPQGSVLEELTGSLLEEAQSATYEPEVKFSVQNILGTFSVITMLAATAAYLGLKRSKATNAKVANSVQKLPPKKLMLKLETESEHLHQERMCSQSGHTEVEMFGESGPSEMSSSLKKSSSYRRRGLDRADEAQSNERKLRYAKRESLASSSEYSGSPSYGSFTTYEKIHGRHGGGDEEVVTPVRRSSRIRKQIVSP